MNSIEPYANKSFHEVITELRYVGKKAGALIEAAIKVGQKEGLTNEEIRNQILEAGIPYRTALEYFGAEMKRSYKRYKSAESHISQKGNNPRTNARLVVDEEPKLPPVKETVIELEPEKPKPKREPIPVRTVREMVLSFGHAVALSNLASSGRGKKEYVVRFYDDNIEIINITARDK